MESDFVSEIHDECFRAERSQCNNWGSKTCCRCAWLTRISFMKLEVY